MRSKIEKETETKLFFWYCHCASSEVSKCAFNQWFAFLCFTKSVEVWIIQNGVEIFDRMPFNLQKNIHYHLYRFFFLFQVLGRIHFSGIKIKINMKNKKNGRANFYRVLQCKTYFLGPGGSKNLSLRKNVFFYLTVPTPKKVLKN